MIEYSKDIVNIRRILTEIEAVTTSKIQLISHDKSHDSLKITYDVTPTETTEIETVIRNHSHEILSEVRGAQKAIIKKAYMQNIVVDIETDDVQLWYEKLVKNEINTPEDDTKYDDNMLIWKNAWQEYKTKKTQIYAETNFEIIKNIQYENQE